MKPSIDLVSRPIMPGPTSNMSMNAIRGSDEVVDKDGYRAVDAFRPDAASSKLAPTASEPFGDEFVEHSEKAFLLVGELPMEDLGGPPERPNIASRQQLGRSGARA
jgi:hypothetical protein